LNEIRLDRIGLDGRPKAGSGVRKHPSRQEASSPRDLRHLQNDRVTRQQNHRIKPFMSFNAAFLPNEQALILLAALT